jgi:hypothetical protein
MLRNILRIIALTAIVAVIALPVARAQEIVRDSNADDDYNGGDTRARIDRYLDAEIWTNHSDDEFYAGDNIVIKFRVNRDAFVAIYSVDSRGRVNLLFPSRQDADNFVGGGTTYSLPGSFDDYDLVVTGPQGTENLQIIASRERFSIPDWYPHSGLEFDGDDRADYMDYLNDRYFVRYDGQKFAYDRTAIYINEWEDDYFRPVYYPYYPNWTVCGNVYVDYPFGGTVYVDGIYWGCAPLYIPRVFVGWHTFTVYDWDGYCWESDVHVHNYNTLILDHRVVSPRRDITSKYKEVQYVGYRNPTASGYPDYKEKESKLAPVFKTRLGTSSLVAGSAVKSKDIDYSVPRKYVRGEAMVVKTERGYETQSVSGVSGKENSDQSGYSSKGKSTSSSWKKGSVTTTGKSKSADQAGVSSDKTSVKEKTYTPASTKTKERVSGEKSSGTETYKQKSSATSSGKQTGSSTQPKKVESGSKQGATEKAYKTTKSTTSEKSKETGSTTYKPASGSSSSTKSSPSQSSKPAGSSGSKEKRK